MLFRLRLPQAGRAHRGAAQSLAGPSLTATSGVTLGGAAVGATGLWKPLAKEHVNIADGLAMLDVPPGSAMLVSLT